jgi:hypothetical protein
VANGEIGSPRKVSTSGSPSLEVESTEASLVAASLVACRLESGGEAGGSAGAPDGVDSEPESDRGFRAGAGGAFVVPAGSFVLLEMSVSESAAESEGGSAPEAIGLAERSVEVTPSEASDPRGVGAHVSVVAAAETEVSVVPAAVSEVSVASGAVVHASALHASVVPATADAYVVSAAVSVVSVVSGPVGHASVVSAAAPASFVVVAEVSVASGGVAHMCVVSDEAPESSVAVAEVSVASGAVVHAPVVSAGPEVSVVEFDEVAGASETDGEGFSARAVSANRDAQRTAASTATVQPTNPRARRRSKRGDLMLGAATDLPSISASSPGAVVVRASSIALDIERARSRDANQRAEKEAARPLGAWLNLK